MDIRLPRQNLNPCDFVPIILFFLINGVFFCLSLYLDFERPFFNVDYLVFFALMILGYHRFSFFSLVFIVLVDFLSLTIQMFPFLNLLESFYLFEFVFTGPIEYLMSIFSLLVLFVAFFFLAKRFCCDKGGLSLFPLLVFLLIIYNLDGYADVTGGRHWVSGVSKRELDSQSVYFYSRGDYGFQKLIENDTENTVKASESQLQKVLNDDAPDRKIFVVVAESLGVSTDPAVDDFLYFPFEHSNIADQFEVSSGVSVFDGITVQAELRELCGVLLDSYNAVRYVRESGVTCIPQSFNRSLALHAASQTMYHRKELYNLLGFSETKFLENFTPDRVCYSFPGMCDLDLLESMFSPDFDANQYDLIYYLSLNTHSPYSERDIRDFLDCSFLNDRDGLLCRYANLHRQFFNKLVSLMLIEKFNEYDFIIVGDHPPRRLGANYRESFEAAEIPVIYFRRIES